MVSLKVYVFKIAVGAISAKVKVIVPVPALFSMLVTVDLCPEAVPAEINSITEPIATPVILCVAAATVTVVVEPPVAV